MVQIPTAASPADGSCNSSQNNFTYNSSADGTSYTLTYCVGGPTGSLSPGSHCATPAGIFNSDCSTGGGGSTPTCGQMVAYGGESYPTVLIGSQCWMAKI